MNEAVRQYLRENGAKGGRAGKGTALRRELNRQAAKARWAKAKPKPKKREK